MTGAGVRKVVEIAVGVPAATEVETAAAIGGPRVTGAPKARQRSIWIS